MALADMTKFMADIEVDGARSRAEGIDHVTQQHDEIPAAKTCGKSVGNTVAM